MADAAKQLGLHESQLYAWRKKTRYEASRSETEKELEIENDKLKRQLAKTARELKATTDPDHGTPVVSNLLTKHFSSTAPNQKLVCDITYLWTGEGWLYPTVVLDLFSRMVVG